MRRPLFVSLIVALATVVCALAAPTVYEGNINLQEKPMDLGGIAQWDIGVKVGNTGKIKFYTYSGTNVFNPSSYTVTFHAGPSRDDSGVIEVAGSAGSTYVEFTFGTNDLAYAFERWYSAVKFTKNAEIVSQPEGKLSCSGAPEVDGGAQNFTYNRNWSLWRFSNTSTQGPYLAGSNVAFRAADTNGRVYIDVDTDSLTNAVSEAQLTDATNTVLGYAQTYTDNSTQTVTVAYEAADTALQAQIGSNDTDIAGLYSTQIVQQARIGTNEADIASLQSQITSNDTDLVGVLYKTNEFAGDVSGVWSNIQLGAGVVTLTEVDTTSLDTRYQTTSTDTQIFENIWVRDTDALDTNISAFSGVYTGQVNAVVAYTNSTPMHVGKQYAVGFYKIGSSGTATLSYASSSLSKTSAGGASTFWDGEGAGDVVLTLGGEALAFCNVSNVYVREVTNGSVHVAHNLYVGEDIYIGSTSTLIFADGEYVDSAKIVGWDDAVVDAAALFTTQILQETAIDGLQATQDVTEANIAGLFATQIVQQARIGTNEVNISANDTRSSANSNDLIIVSARSVGTSNLLVTVDARSVASSNGLLQAQTDINILDVATGGLQTAVGILNTATGSLQAALDLVEADVVVLGTATGTLDDAVGVLNVATGTMQTAISQAQADINALDGETNNFLRHDGTVAWTGNENGGGNKLTNVVELSAGGLDALTIKTLDGGAMDTGGAISILGGDGGIEGGGISIAAGDSTSGGSAGTLTIAAGTSNGDDGGNINVDAGDAAGTNAGNVTITAGTGVGSHGNIFLYAGLDNNDASEGDVNVVRGAMIVGGTNLINAINGKLSTESDTLSTVAARGNSWTGGLAVATSGGNVMIGTGSAEEKLHVRNRVAIGDDLDPSGESTVSLVVGSTSANCFTYFGQSDTRAAGFGWLYNATATSAYGWLYTLAYGNDIHIDCADLLLQNGSGQDVSIGGSEPDNPTANEDLHVVGAISLQNQSGAISTYASGAVLFATNGEFYAKDASGNDTLNSSHKAGVHVAKSRNEYAGVEVTIDLEKLATLVEALTGEEVIRYTDIPAKDWADEERIKTLASEAEHAAWETIAATNRMAAGQEPPLYEARPEPASIDVWRQKRHNHDLLIDRIKKRGNQ